MPREPRGVEKRPIPQQTGYDGSWPGACSRPRSTRGLRCRCQPGLPPCGPTPRTSIREHAEGMSNITTYLISASLILLVIRQIREHPLDARSLATPVLAVGAAAVLFLHSVPVGGSDLVLEAACVLAGAAMGAIGGLATRVAAWRRRPAAGPACRAGRQHVDRRRRRPAGLRHRRGQRRGPGLPGFPSRTRSPARPPGSRAW